MKRQGSWNKGLTKETDPRVAAYSKKCSIGHDEDSTVQLQIIIGSNKMDNNEFAKSISDLPIGWQNFLIKAREAELQKDIPAKVGKPVTYGPRRGGVNFGLVPKVVDETMERDRQESINQQKPVGRTTNRGEMSRFKQTYGYTSKLPVRRGTPSPGHQFEGIHSGTERPEKATSTKKYVRNYDLPKT